MIDYFRNVAHFICYLSTSNHSRHNKKHHISYAQSDHFISRVRECAKRPKRQQHRTQWKKALKNHRRFDTPTICDRDKGSSRLDIWHYCQIGLCCREKKSAVGSPVRGPASAARVRADWAGLNAHAQNFCAGWFSRSFREVFSTVCTFCSRLRSFESFRLCEVESVRAHRRMLAPSMYVDAMCDGWNCLEFYLCMFDMKIVCTYRSLLT